MPPSAKGAAGRFAPAPPNKPPKIDDRPWVRNPAPRLASICASEAVMVASVALKARPLADALAKTTIDWTWSEDILQDMWEKVTFLAALAAMTCLFRGNIAEIMATPEGKAIAMRCFEANAAIARAEGHPPGPKILQWAADRLTRPGPQSASMLRDMEAGKPVEADHIVGHMLSLARKHGIDDTVLQMAWTHLKTYEARRAAGRA